MLSRLSILICAVLVIGSATGARAYNWDGGAGTDKWQDFANWDPDITTLDTDGSHMIGGGWSGGPISITLDGDSTATIMRIRSYTVDSTLTIAAGSQIVMPGPDYCE